MKKLVPFLFCNKISEFKKIFEREFLNNSLTFKGVKTTFAKDDFQHICYETGKGGIKKKRFGIRRARRLLIIKEILNETIPSELLLEEKSGNYCLLCEPLEFAIFLVPVKKTKTLQIGTIIHYGKEITQRIKKQREKCISVKKIFFE